MLKLHVVYHGRDRLGVVDSDFQGIQINFAPPRPTGFAKFRGAGQPFFPRGGAHIPALDMFANNAHTIIAAHGKVVFFSYNWPWQKNIC